MNLRMFTSPPFSFLGFGQIRLLHRESEKALNSCEPLGGATGVKL